MAPLDHDRFTADGLTSTLEFSPTAGSKLDYGTLYCAGENIIGRQAEPCLFTIVPTGEYGARLKGGPGHKVS